MLFLRLIRESFLFAISAILVNRLRTMLTVLGITIGIFSVIIVFTVVDSMQSQITTSIESMGTNVVFVQKWPWQFGGEFKWWEYMKRPQPKMDDLKALQNFGSTIESAAIMSSSMSNVEFGDSKVESVGIGGISEDYNKVFVFDVAQGRYFSPSEFNNGVAVCLLGATVAERLFGVNDPLGQYVKFLNRKVKVIGVLKKEGNNTFGNSNDEIVMVPYSFIRQIIDVDSENSNSFIAVRGKEGIPNEEISYEITGILRARHCLKPGTMDDFSVNEPSMLTQGLAGIFSILTIAGWLIGGFSLLVGGFGIANIMFVSVRERVGIIGIQKSLGAKNYFILVQFLVEAVFLSLFGGLFGLLLVWLLTMLASSALDFSINLSTGNILLGLIVSGTIGLLAGMIPAWSASKLDPVEAIRQN
ncbi:Macrolide export ATP-binding/permease protein MacB [bioreactor metagenome]|uniref:Macrolide export ATP-binding/permease protein MacB n=1 Tax=bioreactor metagenome TaxID=1076179 RepID=A0A644WZ77_9ZZZZ